MRPLLEPIEGPMASWWKPSLMAAMVTIAGLAVFSPVIERWGGLRVVVTPTLVGLLGAFARWWLDRPTVGVPATPGPGALQSLTTLVVVDGDAVMVLPGEHLERRNGILWYGPTAIDTRVHADDAWSRGLDDLAQRACADPIAREDDPWRELLEHGVGITEAERHRRRVARLVAVAVVAASLVVGAEAGWRRAATVWNVTPHIDATRTAEALHSGEWGDYDGNLRRRAAAGDERAIRGLLTFGRDDAMNREEVASLRARLREMCDARWGDPMEASDPVRAVRMALKLRCLDPAEEIPVRVVAMSCVRERGRDACQVDHQTEIELRSEIRRFLTHQLRSVEEGDVRIRAARQDDEAILRLERTSTMTAEALRGTSADELASSVHERADLVDPHGRVLAHLVAERTVTRFVPRAAWWDAEHHISVRTTIARDGRPYAFSLDGR